jgi:putative ABC transport system permease protein
MFVYYLKLALRSLRQNIVMTALMVLAIAVGIGAPMTMVTIFRAASGNPIQQKSAQRAAAVPPAVAARAE